MNYYRNWVDKLGKIERDRPAKEFDDFCRSIGVPTIEEDLLGFHQDQIKYLEEVLSRPNPLLTKEIQDKKSLDN